MRLLNLEKLFIPIGRLRVEPELCKGCGFCIEFCPRKILDFSEEVNSRGYHYPIIKKGMEDLCAACGMCQRICPDYAIYLERIDKVPASKLVR
ncbi:MAG: 4Fe-4S dicluster domain-containing protein [Sulfolobales archaeon]